jgi:serine phosphatase RsbU (regulator of sigma subunit)
MRSITFVKLALAALVAAAVVVIIRLQIPILTPLVQIGLLAIFVLFLGWLLWKGSQRFLWRVGRRLAFSYFLIGLLPIPMVLLMLWICGYLLNGFFLGHLYRDAVSDVRHDLAGAARAQLMAPAGTQPSLADAAVAYYRDGERQSGDDRLPTKWPAWLVAPLAGDEVGPFVVLPDGEPTLGVAVGSAAHGAVAVFTGDLGQELSERSDVWVGLTRSDAPDQPGRWHIQLGERRIPIRPVTADRIGEGREEFFGLNSTEELGFFDRPRVWWGELTPSLLDLQDGSLVAEYVVAALNGSPSASFRHFFSSSAEIDTAAWAALIAISGMLLTIYGVAVLMALVIIIALSRAVNRLSSATSTVSDGDFSVRIPTKRKDQIGQLQRDFNQMTEHLEQLVDTAAQKELLDKELSLARDLQERLIPFDLPKAETIEFATLFEPSAAIGGDYFDILRVDEDRLAVVIADVSGHGLPTGLRMAMLKAALVILVEEKKPPQQILARLSDLIRASGERRYFVTSTIAVVNFRTGRLELTNAGHPPTYLLRAGDVEEILLPGPPLGTLDGDYGQRAVDLQSGDVVVWLSDGLIEASDVDMEPFGYDRLADALRGDIKTPEEARDRLLEALEAHTGGYPADDDRTLVAMSYRQ